ncbi:hypothetical protein AB0D67_09370 [Streptosporangium sp. NPDC048047]|uniref:hypothetical protein n=1 Tax=Streptosporangium sp. NPDC048047 TaxID=3155748 RepID=UPI00344AD679
MRNTRRILPALTACAAAGLLAIGVTPARADSGTPRPTGVSTPVAVTPRPAGVNAPAAGTTTSSARTCGYRVVHVRRGGFLRVRSGPGLRYRPIGRLRVTDGRVHGSCTARHGWIAVKTPTGTSGWSYGYYLRRVDWR